MNQRTGEPILLRLFANRQDAGLKYRWSVLSEPDLGAANLDNPSGATGYSTPFEYHYTKGAEPVLTGSRAGTYRVRVRVVQEFEDAVSGKVGLEAEATALIYVRGASEGGTGDCDCAAVGLTKPGRGFSVVVLLVLGVLLLYRQRRKV
jgi:hypothetical protein